MPNTPIILHACCATCSGYVIEQLLPKFQPLIYFFNPNIHPQEEYLKRRNELSQYALKVNLPFFEEEYLPERWFTQVKGMEQEPERGLRCRICFKQRLEQTADFAKKQGIAYFTTTLTVSPHKKSGDIIDLGNKIAEETDLVFYAQDFKKQNGYKKTVAIAEKEGFYRQNYCGCIYSFRT